MINARRAVRNIFSDCSTGSILGCYYSTKGHAINRFDAALQGFDFCFDRDDLMDFPGDEGRKTIDIYNNAGIVGRAMLAWFRMETGRYEFIGYIT